MGVAWYRQFLNATALKQVNRPVDLPDPHLGVGFAESMASIGNPQKRGVVLPVRKASMQRVTSIDQFLYDGSGKQFAVTDFSFDGYLGGGLA